MGGKCETNGMGQVQDNASSIYVIVFLRISLPYLNFNIGLAQAIWDNDASHEIRIFHGMVDCAEQRNEMREVFRIRIRLSRPDPCFVILVCCNMPVRKLKLTEFSNILSINLHMLESFDNSVPS